VRAIPHGRKRNSLLLCLAQRNSKKAKQAQLVPSWDLLSFCSWESAYTTELANFEHHGDEGEVWFGEDSLYRILRWFDRHRHEVPLTSAILDIGELTLFLSDLANVVVKKKAAETGSPAST
jgi:hypothetical protein